MLIGDSASAGRTVIVCNQEHDGYLLGWPIPQVKELRSIDGVEGDGGELRDDITSINAQEVVTVAVTNHGSTKKCGGNICCTVLYL